MSDFRAIGDRSALGNGKDHQRSGLGERAYVPTLLLKKKDGGGSMCAEIEKRKKSIPGSSLIEAPDVAEGSNK